jgi:DNA-binding MarR family transcriptional regulator
MSTNQMMDAYSNLKRELSLIVAENLKAASFGHNQMLVIYFLTRSPLSMNELSSLCNSDPASTTRTVASLEKAGLVKRRRDPNDSRKAIIELTRKGLSRAEEVHELRSTIGTLLNETLSTEEQNQFVQLLSKVSQQLRDRKLKRESL